MKPDNRSDLWFQ